LEYAYDYAGNRLFSNANRNGTDHIYAYDDLNRLKSSGRGNLPTTPADPPVLSRTADTHAWSLDALGNWTDFDFDFNGDGSFGTGDLQQERTHNGVNEITAIGIEASGQGDDWIDPVFDTAGNMTQGPKPGDEKKAADGKEHRYTYDAWNRMVKVEVRTYTSPTVAGAWSDVAVYEYDGRNRRIEKTDKTGAADVDYDYYYNQSWQVLETHEAGDATYPLVQNVYHPHYVDAIALRWYDDDTDGTFETDTDTGATNDGLQYYAHDANYNVIAVFMLNDPTGTPIPASTAVTVLERYDYSPYGEVRIFDGGYTASYTTSQIGNPYLYTGRRYDEETGLYHYRRRYYNARLGRFINRDPILYDGGDMNLNAYVGCVTEPVKIHLSEPELLRFQL